MTREEVLSYVKEQYDTEPDYPWRGDPDSAVLRHGDSRKWYGLLMYVSRRRLGLADPEPADILNLKCDPAMGDILRAEPGIFPAYHMSHTEWISVLLDGTVPRDRVLDLIDISYAITASKKKKERLRGPVDWIIPANPKYYDVEAGFQENPVMEWKQTADIRAGDTIYMYMAAPVCAVLYKCRAVEVNLPYHYEDENLTIKKAMKIELLERYAPDRFTREFLQGFGVCAVRSQRKIPHSLSCEMSGQPS